MLVAVLIIVMALASCVLLVGGLGNRRKGGSGNPCDPGYFPNTTDGSGTGETHHSDAGGVDTGPES